MTAQQEVTRMATKIANRRARSELLPGLAVHFSVKSLKGLNRSWAPFKATGDESEYGYTLRVQDPMVVAILKDKNLYAKAQQIAMESMVEAMIDSTETRTFIQDIVDQLKVAS